MVSKFLSNVLYTQPFDPRDDIMVSFLYSAPGNRSGDFLLLQGGQFDEAILELQTDNDLMVLNFTEDNSQFNGLGVFLVNGNTPTLTGGGGSATSTELSAFDPGIGMVTDTNTTAQSAISGIILAVALDQSGAFGKINSLNQFTTGTVDLNPGNIAARTFNVDDSTFPFIGSVTPSAPTVVEDVYNIFRVGFKRRLQDIVIYTREGNIYEPDITLNTNMPLDALPETVKIGFTYSGTQPIDLKNITINGCAIDTE
jgi:hypothetical protein